jgi:ribosomal-protein-alanine N-acetyltransferase
VSEFRLETARLAIRSWEAADRSPFAAMNADPAVMEFFFKPLTPSESDALVEVFEAELSERGFCPWAVEELSSGDFIGFVGLHAVPPNIPCAPATEVGWRLARPFWGRGYATEAASAAVEFGFGSLGMDSVVSFTSVLNVRSRRVMQRLGMTHDEAEDFDHPRIPEDHPLRPHVLYRLYKGGPKAARSSGQVQRLGSAVQDA